VGAHHAHRLAQLSTAKTLQHMPQGPQDLGGSPWTLSTGALAWRRHLNGAAHGHQTDWPAITADLEQLLKLRSIPFGMKLFADRADMEAIPRIRGRSMCTPWTSWSGQARGWAGRWA
jgi:hypothetical protein